MVSGVSPRCYQFFRENMWENEADPGPEGDGTDGLQHFGDRCGGEPAKATPGGWDKVLGMSSCAKIP